MITVTLTQQDLDSLQALIDAGVRASGLQALKPAMAIITKLEEAVSEANKKANKVPTEEDNG